jgi:hypothetical protein
MKARGDQRRARRMLWLAPVAFLAHCAEELPRFPAWATRHFGTTTTRFYVASHCVLLPGAFGLTGAGARPGANRRGTVVAAAIPAALVNNAAFHLLTTARFREYSPGVVTASVVTAPVSLVILWRLRRDRILRGRDLLYAALAGTALNALAVASLRFDMPRLGG